MKSRDQFNMLVSWLTSYSKIFNSDGDVTISVERLVYIFWTLLDTHVPRAGRDLSRATSCCNAEPQFWHSHPKDHHKLRKFLSLKLYSIYLKFYSTHCLIICRFEKYVHSDIFLKFWLTIKTTWNIIPVWNNDLRLFLFYGLDARQSLFTGSMARIGF